MLFACGGSELRAAEHVAPAPLTPPVTLAPATSRRPTYQPPEDCGGAVLEHAVMLHFGKGERHPDRLAVEAKLATCPKPLEPSPEACLAVAKEHAERARDLGPHHPVMRELAVKTDLCRDVPPPPPPPKRPCDEVKRQRDDLISHGKGPRHPLVLEAEAEMSNCLR